MRPWERASASVTEMEAKTSPAATQEAETKERSPITTTQTTTTTEATITTETNPSLAQSPKTSTNPASTGAIEILPDEYAPKKMVRIDELLPFFLPPTAPQSSATYEIK